MDEQAFLDAVRAADPDAYRRLVDREVDAVFRLAYRIVGNVHDAEEVAQDTFVIAYRSIETFRGEGAIGAWLRTIAARLAIRHVVRRSGPDHEARRTDVVEIIPEEQSPLVRVLSDERAAAIRRSIASLPEAQREVVTLRFFGDLSLAEIAAVTGRPLPTCKSHLRRGLGRLRTLLRGEVAA